MLSRFAHLATRRPRAVLVAAVVFVALAGGYGGGVAADLVAGGFEDPATESVRAEEALADRFDTGVPNLVLLVTAPEGVDDPAAAAAGRALTDHLAAEAGVADVVSYWSEGGAPPLRNGDGTRALVVARITGDDDEVTSRVEDLAPRYEGASGPLDVEVGGFAQVFHDIGTTIEEDLLTAEMIALPVTLALLVVIFGSVVAATLPLLIGVLSIIGTFGVLQAITGFTDVSVYALNLTTALGLGLAIDYSLFVVSRYREEIARTGPGLQAMRRTLATAGRTVLFSAVTVAGALSTTASSSSPATARSCAAATSRTRPWCARCAPPGAPSPSAP